MRLARIKDNNLVAVAVLSGNRQFRGPYHHSSRKLFASPPLVVRLRVGWQDGS